MPNYCSYSNWKISNLIIESVRFETDPAPPSVSISDRSESGVRVNWSDVPKTETYRLILTGNGDSVTQELSANTKSFEFDDLEPWTVYTIDVISEQGEKSFPGKTTFRTRKFKFLAILKLLYP